MQYTLEIHYRPGEIRINYQHLTERGETNNGTSHWVAEGTQKKF